MQVKRIKCPNCNAVLDVKNSKDERQKHILCPGCKAELLVKFPQPLVAETVIANGKYNDGATHIIYAAKHRTQRNSTVRI